MIKSNIGSKIQLLPQRTERKTRMEKVKEQYEKANKVYAQLSAENKQKINRLIAETLAKQQLRRR